VQKILYTHQQKEVQTWCELVMTRRADFEYAYIDHRGEILAKRESELYSCELAK
jgi:hypothetical protein